jgi:hypothetical protein
VVPDRQTVVRAGTVLVAGIGKEQYFVYDSTGQDRLAEYRATNSAVELLPGAYIVVLNNSKQRVNVVPDRQTVVRAGTVLVAGTGKDGYSVWDSAGTSYLAGGGPTNSVIELLPGTYVIKLNNSRQRVTVAPDRQTVVRAGTVLVAGTGKDGYSVWDSAGTSYLAGDGPTNSAVELLPGRYTVKAGDLHFKVQVRPGQQTKVGP